MRKSTLALAAFITLSSIGLSQDPATPAPPAVPAAGAPDAAVEAWLKTLIEKIAAENPTIRRSVQAAVESVGAPAIPHLKKAASGEGPAAQEAERLITRIERRGQNRPAEGGRQGQPGQGRGFGMERLYEQLGLNAEQTAKVTAMTEARQAKMGEMREKLMSGEMTRDEFREHMTSAQAEIEKELSGVLTEAQMKQYKEMMQSMGPRGGRGQGGQGGQGGEGQGGRRRGQIED